MDCHIWRIQRNGSYSRRAFMEKLKVQNAAAQAVSILKGNINFRDPIVSICFTR